MTVPQAYRKLLRTGIGPSTSLAGILVFYPKISYPFAECNPPGQTAFADRFKHIWLEKPDFAWKSALGMASNRKGSIDLFHNNYNKLY